jgi:uncharacterized protein with HEPN domain
MFSDKNLAYILTTLEAIEKINLYTKEFDDPEVFYEANDQLNFNATYNLLIVVGEESKKIDSLLRKSFANVPWPKIAGLRNHLVHEYRGTDPSILYDIVKKYLPELKIALIEMLSKVDFDENQFKKIIDSPHYKHIKYLLKK